MSNVQFNLLPDIKMAHAKTLRTRNLVVSIAVLASGIALGILILLFVSVNIVQKKQMGDADKDIESLTNQIKNTPNIETALTSQNQLESLSGLHRNKHISSRIFGFLPQVVPSNVSVKRVNLDFTTNTLSIEGSTDSQVAFNTFVDTLKFTNFKIGNEEGDGKKAFTTITPSSYSLSDEGVTYALDVVFDPTLFSNNLLDGDGKPQAPVLIVPKLTTTHASSEDPANLFKEGQDN